MRIGVDIDGVLADSLPLWVHELNSYFNKNKRVEELHLFDICRSFEVTPDELSRFIELKGEYLMSEPSPMTGAPHYLGRIKQNHEIFIITARSERFRRETQKWLEKHDIPYNGLFLLGSHEKKGVCLEKDLHVMVEDTLEIGKEVSLAGVPVLLLDAPYNKGALPGMVYRKRSWDEIYQAIATGPLPVNH